MRTFINLQRKIKEIGLEEDYDYYQIRLCRSYLAVFFVLQILVNLTHCTLLIICSDHTFTIYFDICVYVVSAVLTLSVLSINFFESIVMRHKWIMFVSSLLAVLIMVGTDVGQGMYHKYFNNWKLGTFYEVYTIFVIYMFLPTPFIHTTIFLGIVASVMYIIYFEGMDLACTTCGTSTGIVKDFVHFACINLLGIFYRLLINNTVRASFWDRYLFVTQKLMHQNARNREAMLLNTILPPQISHPHRKEIKRKLALVKLGTDVNKLAECNRLMALQFHPEVSILFADMVNYTHLTTTVSVEVLLKILHDLYGRFDMAAEKFHALRIKFLGDCYYCVAGISSPDADHAKHCVDLGLLMIAEIKSIRNLYNLDVHMRIGVHSGSLFAGVLGIAKLQFDIWGEDVSIANALEQSGVTDCVHISLATLNCLSGYNYDIQPGPVTALNHPVIEKYNIQTFIIKRNLNVNDNSYMSLSNASCTTWHSKAEAEVQYHNSVVMEELREEFRNMPVIKLSCLGFRTAKKDLNFGLSRICLTHHDRNMRYDYENQRDYMFKYSMLLVFLLSVCMLFIQFDNENTEKYCVRGVICNSVVLIFYTILTFIAWYKKICWHVYEKNTVAEVSGYNKVSCFIFSVYDGILASLPVRIGIYSFITISNGLLIFIIVVTVNLEQIEIEDMESKIYNYSTDAVNLPPWVMTNMMCIFICLVFTFTNIPFRVKTRIGCILVFLYLVIILGNYVFLFHHSITSNPFFPAEYAHAMAIGITALTVYKKERLFQFACKLNFNWRQELIIKHAEVQLTHESITVLLQNILPVHVVNVYLNLLDRSELYFENYEMVSVMFAMLMNFQINLKNLSILNDIITDFDMLLYYYKEYYEVEKIKVVGCTYMAACGLDVNFAGSISKMQTISSLFPYYLHEFNEKTIDGKASIDEVVYVLASYALDMMRKLSECQASYNNILDNSNFFNGTISIGLSCGEVMAGIVGASQPHYDIWGNTVNMASRMQSTGLAGNIHVTEESAKILMDYGIHCIYRGETYVKGRGIIPTYLVAIDEDLNFILTDAIRHPSHTLRSTQLSYSDAFSVKRPPT
ncbi:hypothetical protein KR018_004798 [Drosophila ironensis]|nr:hypothetical protein KR018_004798 [Drosophila ironensis]